MEHRTLGGSGVSISRIGLGGYELGPEEGETPDRDRAVRVLEASLDAGVDWLDTSELYLATHNETLIGEALALVSREVLVCTKASPDGATQDAFRRDRIHEACRASLRRLGRDHLDVYLLHSPDETGVPLEETWGAMVELAEAGLVRAIGLSNFELDQIERCHAERRVDLVQDGLSILDYLDVRAMFAAVAELGVSVTVFEPLASGILGGKTIDEVRATWTGEWREMPFFQRLLVPGKAERSSAVVEGMRPIAARLGATVAQVAIAWVLRQEGVDAAIAGSHSGGHMQENASSADLDLSSVVHELEALIPLGPNFD